MIISARVIYPDGDVCYLEVGRELVICIKKIELEYGAALEIFRNDGKKITTEYYYGLPFIVKEELEKKSNGKCLEAWIK